MITSQKRADHTHEVDENPGPTTHLFVIQSLDISAVDRNAQRITKDCGWAGQTYHGLVVLRGEGCAITLNGWRSISRDSRRLQANILAWIRKTFVGVAIEGRPNGFKLAGWLQISGTDLEQLPDRLATGIPPDASKDPASPGLLFESFARDIWEGVSDFSRSVLEGSIKFDKAGACELTARPKPESTKYDENVVQTPNG